MVDQGGEDLIAMDELQRVGLLDAAPSPHLTPKGREWLKALEDLETAEVVEMSEGQADFVLSTNGLSR